MISKSQNLTKYLTKSQLTFRYDCLRGIFNHIIYTGLSSVALLIAIRHFNAPGWVKSYISGSEHTGKLLAPLMLLLGAKSHLRSSGLSTLYYIFCAVFLLIASLAHSLLIYVVAIILTEILFAQIPQIMLHIYSTNYPSNKRGKYFSITFAIGALITIIFPKQIGIWLDINVDYFHFILVALAASALIASFSSYQIPSEPLKSQSTPSSIWKNLSLLWKDHLFGWLIFGYVILGIGNAMVAPLRIEYMLRPEYKILASNEQIIIINVLIPNISMVLFTPIWGWLFDRLHFITTRLLINAAFIVSYLTFFTSTNFFLLTISAIFTGLATAAGMVIWQLWVTKVAPENQVSAYMSVHCATSGARGLIAPQLGYFFLYLTNALTVGVIAALLMSASAFIFFCVRRHPRIL